MLRINQIKLHINHTEEDLKKAILKRLRLPETGVVSYEIVKQSIDARKSVNAKQRSEIFFTYTVDAVLKDEKAFLKVNKDKDIIPRKAVHYAFTPTGTRKLNTQPVIIGTGPGGLFCGLLLARAGYRPILLEQGAPVEERQQDVEVFWNTGRLNPASNVQFGEGGAGTFSDGKLNTLIKDKEGRGRFVLKTFVDAGAPPEILYQNKPHIGTDVLVQVVKHLREEIISLGGSVRFHTKVTDIETDGQRLTGLILNDQELLKTDCAIVAIGHSARDTFYMLHKHQLHMTPKAFAIGLRIQHPQEMIHQVQYGDGDKKLLPAADYKLTCHTQNGRSVYTFCMCPGGFVVNASSEEGGLVVNGMSNHDRGGINANSAVVVNVTPEDFKDSTSVLAGIEFQRHWEKLAYEATQGSCAIPVQLFKDFKAGQVSAAYGEVEPEIKGTAAFADLNTCLPSYVCESLKEGITYFGRQIPGFDRPDALLAGVETRTSSPVRLERNDLCESSIQGLFPCGEGAGYAGGITSAAIDGMRVAEAIGKTYERMDSSL